MGFHDNTHKAAADAVAAAGAYGTVFTDDSGTTGANEASGVTRQLVTWPTGSMSGGKWTKVAAPVDIPVPNGLYKEAGIFSAVSAGNFVVGQPFIGGNVSVSGGGGVISTTFTIKA